jgi:Kef-type K+ transport system membrane component KefB
MLSTLPDGLPQVGQIVMGIAVGPHGLEIAPKHDALMLMGELGLVLMVLEAGIEVELSEVCSLFTSSFA